MSENHMHIACFQLLLFPICLLYASVFLHLNKAAFQFPTSLMGHNIKI